MVLHTGYMQPINQLSVFHLPIAGIHCPIYMYRAHLYAIVIYSLLPSMLHYLSADMLCDRCRCTSLAVLQSYYICNLLIISEL